MRELRIHHLFDIIRDYGSGKKVDEHPFGHSYHTVAREIYENKLTSVKLVIKNDDICENCIKLEADNCVDKIDHRADFSGKQEFNDYLDKKIMTCMGYDDGQIITIERILRDAFKYIDSIYDLYDGNDLDHTEARKNNVSRGIRKKLEAMEV